MMPGKADKPTQNSALQGISEQENFMIRVLFICHGNICRSTLAESVFTHKVISLGLAHNFEIDSFATSREEIGNPPHYGTVNKLREEHIPLVPHHANIRNLNRMLKNDPDGKVYKFLSFTGSGRDIADPWYTGDFEATYRDVVEGCNGFLAYLRREGKI